MKKAVIIAITLCVMVLGVSAEETVDKGMKVPDLKLKMSFTQAKGAEIKAGVDLFDLFGAKTTTSAVPVNPNTSATSGGDDGFFKSAGSWISDNPWKTLGGLVIVAGAAYAINDASSSSGEKKGAVAGQGGTASSQVISLAGNQGSIVFNYTGGASSGQSGRDTVPFVEEVVAE